VRNLSVVLVSLPCETSKNYNRFKKIICVSQTVFRSAYDAGNAPQESFHEEFSHAAPNFAHDIFSNFFGGRNPFDDPFFTNQVSPTSAIDCSIHLYFRPSIRPSVRPSIHPHIHSFILSSIRLPILASIHIALAHGCLYFVTDN
jgi:hypothetical protein